MCRNGCTKETRLLLGVFVTGDSACRGEPVNYYQSASGRRLQGRLGEVIRNLPLLKFGEFGRRPLDELDNAALVPDEAHLGDGLALGFPELEDFYRRLLGDSDNENLNDENPD